MAETSCRVMRDDNPSQAIDYTIGTFFVICLISGVVSNSISIFYFYKSRNPRVDNANKIFFNRIYTVISFVNIVVAIFNFPHLEAAFLPQRCSKNMLLMNKTICSSWNAIWSLFSQISMFMVALLSVSRLLLIISPSKNLPLILPFIFPLVCSTIMTVPIICFKCLYDSTAPRYTPEAMTCIHVDTNMLPETIHDHEGRVIVHFNHRKLISIFATIQGSPILPIVMSFILSLVYLRKAATSAKKANASINRHVEASKTVAAVTLLYLICNVPEFSYLLYLMVNTSLLPETNNVTKREYSEVINSLSSFVGWYSYPTFCMLGMNIFSAFSPLVLFWRIKSFREYFLRRSTVSSRSINSS